MSFFDCQHCVSLIKMCFIDCQLCFCMIKMFFFDYQLCFCVIKMCFFDFQLYFCLIKGISFLFQSESHIISFTIKNNSKILLIQFRIKVRVVWAPFSVLKPEYNTATNHWYIFIIHNCILIYSTIHELVRNTRKIKQLNMIE